MGQSEEAVKKIEEKIKETEGILKYNIFSILKVEHSELKHSLFIKRLLDSSHTSVKQEYLESFLKKVLEIDIKVENIEIEVEKDLEVKVEENLKKFGRADIWLKDKNGKEIIIENKIFAGDQFRQLERYHKYLVKRKSKGNLYYLTLDGREATTSSTNNKKAQYKPIAYKKILNWLDEIKEKDSDYKCSIGQYSDVVKSLILQYEVAKIIKEHCKNIENIDEFRKNIESKEINNFIEENNLLDYVKSNFELEFWTELEDGLIKKGYEIYDRKKYNYQKIEQRRKGKSEVWYGLIYKEKTQKEYNRICISGENKYLKKGKGYFDEEKEKNWHWSEKAEEIKPIEFEKLIKNESEIEKFIESLIK